MEYCFKNVGKDPASVFGMTIAPNKTSRALTMPEVKLAWKSELPEAIRLVPFLLEADVQNPTKELETVPVTEEMVTPKRGRRKTQEVAE